MISILSSLSGCQSSYQVVWDSDRSIVDAEFNNRQDAEKYVEYYKNFHEYKILVDYRLSSSLTGEENGKIHKTHESESGNSQGRLSISK